MFEGWLPPGGPDMASWVRWPRQKGVFLIWFLAFPLTSFCQCHTTVLAVSRHRPCSVPASSWQCPTTVLAVSRRRPGSVPAVSRHHPARRRSLESDLSMYKWSSNGAQMELPRGSNAQMEPNEAQMEPGGAQMELQMGSSLNGAHWSSSGARLSSNGAGGRGMVERGLW